MEVLLVLTIAGILMGAAVSRFGGSRRQAVVTVMNQVEAALQQAQHSTEATGRDVALTVRGTWIATDGIPFQMDPRPYVWPLPTGAVDPFLTPRMGGESERLVSHFPSVDGIHRRAGVATDETGNSLVKSLGETAMFLRADNQSLADALKAPLCQWDKGSSVSSNLVMVNGRNHQFTSPFCIVITGLLDGGSPDLAGMVGVLVVPRNSTHIFRYIRPAGSRSWIQG